MKRVEAKVVENRKEDPASEPDRDPNTWLIEAKLDEDILDWESVRKIALPVGQTLISPGAGGRKPWMPVDS